MSSISHNGDSISYTYDPDGIRTSKMVNGTTTKFHIMNGTLLGPVSYTHLNPIRNAIGSSAYDTAKTASTLISAGGASWIASSPYLGNSSSSAPKAGFVSSASPNSSVQGKPTFVAPPMILLKHQKVLNGEDQMPLLPEKVIM